MNWIVVAALVLFPALGVAQQTVSITAQTVLQESKRLVDHWNSTQADFRNKFEADLKNLNETITELEEQGTDPERLNDLRRQREYVEGVYRRVSAAQQSALDRIKDNIGRTVEDIKD